MIPVLPAGSSSQGESRPSRDPFVTLPFLILIAVCLFLAFRPAPVPAPFAPVAPFAPFAPVAPVAPARPVSPCGPNRCPYRETLSGGLSFEYGCPWCSLLVPVFTEPGDFRSIQPRCSRCNNKLSVHPLRDNSGQLSGATGKAETKKAETVDPHPRDPSFFAPKK